MNLTRAQIVILETDSGEVEVIECMINPAEYSISKNTKYAKKNEPGKDDTEVQYLHGDGRVMSVSLYFDTSGALAVQQSYGSTMSEPESVSTYTDKLEALTRISGTLHRPPKVAFRWGGIVFNGVISSLSQTFTYFSMGGMPLRAKVTLSIDGIDDGIGPLVSPKSSPDRTKYKTLSQGMTLWQIAYEEYGDTDQWKLIASTNGILNPLDIKPGQILTIPAI